MESLRTPEYTPRCTATIPRFRDLNASRSGRVVTIDLPAEAVWGDFDEKNPAAALKRSNERVTGQSPPRPASTILHEQGSTREHLELHIGRTRKRSGAAYDHALYWELG